ncbi:MAG: hypothetical protein ACFCU4_01355 [Puniceicoccaceae bacterium]
MAAVLVLVLGLASAVRTTNANAPGSASQILAEQNALFALQIAIGEVQSQLGPDQRVSSTAAILTDQPIPNPHWTASWSWETEALIDPDAPQPPLPVPHWLVSSGGSSDPMDIVPPARAVTIVGAENVQELSDQVVVERLDLSSGGYAFWVGDEGVKARFDLSDPFARDDPASPRRFHLAQRVGVEALFPSEIPGYQSNGPENQRIFTSEMIGLLNADLDSLSKNAFHDLTTSSRGLLTSTLHGGLKSDLSILFEEDRVDRFRSFFSPGKPVNPQEQDYWLYRDPLNRIDEIGPNFGILRDFYRLHRSVDPARQSLDPIPPNPQKLELANWNGEWPMQSNWPDRDQYHENSPIHPVVSLIQLSLGFSFIPNEPVDGLPSSRLQIRLYPIVGLYNPYNVNLAPATYRVEWGMQPNIEVVAAHRDQPDTLRTASFNLQRVATVAGRSSDETFIRMETAEPVGFEPGQIRYLVPSGPTSGHFSPSLENFPAVPLVGDSSALGYIYYNVEDGLFTNGPPVWGDIFSLYTSEADLLLNLSASAEFRATGRFNTAEKAYYLRLIDGDQPKDLQIITRLWDSEGNNLSSGPRNDRKFEGRQNSWPNIASAAQSETFSTWAVGLRTTEQPEFTSLRVLLDANPRALVNDVFIDGFREGKGYGLVSLFEVPSLTLSEDARYGVLGPNDAIEPEFLTEYNGLWGNFYTVQGQENVLLYDVPRSPLLSLGALQHSPLSRFSYDPAYLVGQSYANVRVPRHRYVSIVSLEKNGRRHYFFDLAYLINHRIWDGYFFSSINPRESLTKIQERLAGPTERPSASFLPNTRLKPAFGDSIELPAASLASRALESAESLHQASRLIGGHLLTEGAFNINSTSVDAWEAVLSSLNDLDLKTHQPSSDASQIFEESLPVFSRFGRPYGGAFSQEMADNTNFWRGYRHLTQPEVRALATAMVDQVRARGPFLSLGQFVNRKLEAGPLGLSGALQSALDATVNSFPPEARIDSQPFTPTLADNGGDALFFDENISDLSRPSRAAGHAGYLLQGDLLQALGPVIAPRSDTFRIRGYGEQRHPATGEVVARALCEAIVQRFPTPLDPSAQLSDEELANPSGPFGRRFEVVTFRWLTPPD